jgi:methylglyoxal synthase
MLLLRHHLFCQIFSFFFFYVMLFNLEHDPYVSVLVVLQPVLNVPCAAVVDSSDGRLLQLID